MLTVVILNEIYHITATPLNIDKDIVYTLTLLIIMENITILILCDALFIISFLFYDTIYTKCFKVQSIANKSRQFKLYFKQNFFSHWS
mgnify:CR=1 FL=1